MVEWGNGDGLNDRGEMEIRNKIGAVNSSSFTSHFN